MRISSSLLACVCMIFSVVQISTAQIKKENENDYPPPSSSLLLKRQLADDESVSVNNENEITGEQKNVILNAITDMSSGKKINDLVDPSDPSASSLLLREKENDLMVTTDQIASVVEQATKDALLKAAGKTEQQKSVDYYDDYYQENANDYSDEIKGQRLVVDGVVEKEQQVQERAGAVISPREVETEVDIVSGKEKRDNDDSDDNDNDNDDSDDNDNDSDESDNDSDNHDKYDKDDNDSREDKDHDDHDDKSDEKDKDDHHDDSEEDTHEEKSETKESSDNGWINLNTLLFYVAPFVGLGLVVLLAAGLMVMRKRRAQRRSPPPPSNPLLTSSSTASGTANTQKGGSTVYQPVTQPA